MLFRSTSRMSLLPFRPLLAERMADSMSLSVTDFSTMRVCYDNVINIQILSLFVSRVTLRLARPIIFGTPGREWRGLSYLPDSAQDVSRATIVAVRVRRSVIRIQIARRAIRIVRIAAKTQGVTSIRSFNLSLTVRGSRSHCRTCRDAAGFVLQTYVIFSHLQN